MLKIKDSKGLIIGIAICIAILAIRPIRTIIRNNNARSIPVNGVIVEIDQSYSSGGRYIISNNNDCIAVDGDSINATAKHYIVKDTINTTIKDLKEIDKSLIIALAYNRNFKFIMY